MQIVGRGKLALGGWGLGGIVGGGVEVIISGDGQIFVGAADDFLFFFVRNALAEGGVLAGIAADGLDVLDVVAHRDKAANLLEGAAAEVATEAAGFDDKALVGPVVAVLGGVGVELDFVDADHVIVVDEAIDFGELAAGGSAVAHFVVGHDALFGGEVAVVAGVLDEEAALARDAVAAVAGEEHGAFAGEHRPDDEVQFTNIRLHNRAHK